MAEGIAGVKAVLLLLPSFLFPGGPADGLGLESSWRAGSLVSVGPVYASSSLAFGFLLPSFGGSVTITFLIIPLVCLEALFGF